MRQIQLARHLSVAAVAAGLVLFAASPSIAGADRVRAEGDPIRYGSVEHVPDGATARVQAVYNAALRLLPPSHRADGRPSLPIPHV